MDAVEVDPSYFLDSARLDIMCRYLYVKSKNENTNHLHYKEMYKECIQAQTQGVEPTDKYIKDQTPKNTIQDYIDSFDELEKIAYEIAKEHLESSFDIVKSVGFLKWIKKNKV